MKRLGSIFALALAWLCFAQTQLTNESVIKMVKADLGEAIIISTINGQPAKFATSADDLINLKQAGVSDNIIHAMIVKMSGGGAAAPAAAASAASPEKGPVSEVGVYYKKNEVWTDLPPEVVNFKTGGVLKTIGTAGIVKGDINGRVNGEHSRTVIKTPVSLLVYASEGVAITEYQLLRLRGSKDAREFRTVTGGVLHVSGGQTRDVVPFESKKVAPRTWEIVLPNLGEGDYGLLPPASTDATASSGRIGKVYSFRILD